MTTTTTTIPTTSAALRAACVLKLCYSDTEIQALLDRIPSEGLESVLLSLPQPDAHHALAGLLPQHARIEWANAAASRAKAYADRAPGSARAADAAACAAAYADYAADAAYAARAAADAYVAYVAARAAADAYVAYVAARAAHADADAEHRTAVEHAVALLTRRADQAAV